MARRRVLIGSQDQEVLTMFAELGQEKGFECDVASTSPDLLFQLLETDYGMVLVDLDLPCAGGAKMVGVVRRMRPKVPVVVLSGDPSVELGGRILQEGVAYYSVKPAAKATLRNVVDAVLARPP